MSFAFSIDFVVAEFEFLVFIFMSLETFSEASVFILSTREFIYKYQFVFLLVNTVDSGILLS